MNEKQARGIVEKEFGVNLSVKNRKRIFVGARSVYYHICIKYGLHLTYEVFTAEIGYKHSTVINAMNQFNNALDTGQWEFNDELRMCEDRAILMQISAGAAEVKDFESIEEVNKKFKRDLYIMVGAYTKVITAYESKIKKQKIELLKTKIVEHEE